MSAYGNGHRSTALTPDAIRTMYRMDSSMDNELFIPLVQVLRLQRMPGGDEKWAVSLSRLPCVYYFTLQRPRSCSPPCRTSLPAKVVLSDGQHFLYGECAPELNKMIHQHVIAQNAVIQIRQFAMSPRGDPKLCYILEAQQAAPNPGVSLGSPVDVRLLDGGQPVQPSREPYTVPTAGGFFSSRSRPSWQNEYRDAVARQGMIINL